MHIKSNVNRKSKMSYIRTDGLAYITVPNCQTHYKTQPYSVNVENNFIQETPLQVQQYSYTTREDTTIMPARVIHIIHQQFKIVVDILSNDETSSICHQMVFIYQTHNS